jgi:hypothetical protein
MRIMWTSTLSESQNHQHLIRYRCVAVWLWLPDWLADCDCLTYWLTVTVDWDCLTVTVRLSDCDCLTGLSECDCQTGTVRLWLSDWDCLTVTICDCLPVKIDWDRLTVTVWLWLQLLSDCNCLIGIWRNCLIGTVWESVWVWLCDAQNLLGLLEL